MRNSGKHPASFRDPSGFLYERDGILFRQVNQTYKSDYDLLISSGLYDALLKENLLIPHEEVEVEPEESSLAYKIIRPERVPFISYPYEWCFSEIKDAALTTLQIQKVAFNHGLTLKDASAYNIQFRQGRPTMIDSLSFEAYREGEPWVAYRQFCQHFLAPLALISYVDVRLSQLMRVYIDGIPLDLASKLLPAKSKLNFSLLTHIHLHASSQMRYADKEIKKDEIQRKMNRNALQGLIENLESGVRKLDWKPYGTEWGDYYEETHNYAASALEHKKTLVDQFLDASKPGSVWDLGANTGLFSRISSDKKIPTISFDIDPAAVELNYLNCKKEEEKDLLPLLLDLTNPSAGLGWGNRERMSFYERGPVDLVMALALVHHLAISNNVPLPHLAEFFDTLCKWLIIEFVPKSDSQVRRLLASREDIFPGYTKGGFEGAFSAHFKIREAVSVQDSDRTMYLMESLSP